ncbi:MAG: hypothetical protein OEM59_11305 [Rhodospirillales bacterium]|nr:hypothetical protein [Rhodospirillales bacterium]
MERERKNAFTPLAIAILLLGMVVLPDRAPAAEAEAGAVQVAEQQQRYREPRAGEMIVDGLVVRPFSFVATVLGSAAFVITLPFSAAGGNVDQAWDKMVEGPAAYTFTRCLGCLRKAP